MNLSLGRHRLRLASGDSVRESPVFAGPLRFLHRRREQILFVVVGIWNTAFAFAVWALLQSMLQEHLHYLVILVLAWPIAVLNAYVCHRHFVFRSSAPIREELPRFSVVYIVTLLGALVALPILLGTLPFNIYVVQAGYTVAVVVLSYLGHKLFSFRGSRLPAGGPHLEEHRHDEP
jgi:putative flippase GtrA